WHSHCSCQQKACLVVHQPTSILPHIGIKVSNVMPHLAPRKRSVVSRTAIAQPLLTCGSASNISHTCAMPSQTRVICLLCTTLWRSVRRPAVH
ncbi:hypothetical protein T265_11533, partial [Opisthorchis viverrini]